MRARATALLAVLSACHAAPAGSQSGPSTDATPHAATSAQPAASASAASSPAPVTASSGRPSLAGAVCERVERDQRALLDDARRAASKSCPAQRVANPMYGPAGGLFSLPDRNTSWPSAADAAVALRTRLHSEALSHARRDKDAKAIWVLERSAPSADAFVNVSQSLYPAGACQPTAHGAWSIEAASLACSKLEDNRSYLGEAVAWSASLALVHYDVHDQRVTLPLEKCCGEHFDGEQAHDLPRFYDYDGDGEPEVILHTRILSDGSVDERPTRLMTFRDGAIVPYARAEALELFGSAVDADRDGRPDFLTHAGIRVAGSAAPPCGREPVAPYAPAFLVHSLDGGGFSTTDAVAKEYAKSWCPSPPTSIRDPDDAGCARLWASTPESVTAEKARVAASCVDPGAKKCSVRLAANEVEGCHLRSDAFAKTPPFTLP